MNKKIENNEQPTASDIKGALWRSMKGLEAKTMKDSDVTAMAKAATGILKTVSLEYEISKDYNIKKQSLVDFIDPAKYEQIHIPGSTDQAINQHLRQLRDTQEPSNN